jgi:hypothetical protein
MQVTELSSLAPAAVPDSSTAGIVPAALPAGLTQWQRVTNTFTAPSKTFEEIKLGKRSWWLPFLVMIMLAYIFFAAITFQVGWSQVAENTIHLNPKSEARMAKATEAQRAASMKFTQYMMEGSFAASPLLVLSVGAVISLVMWGTVNLLFGGRATFDGVFAVWMYASLPSIIKSVLATIVLFVGMAPESFNLSNPSPTNLGAFLSPADTNAGLYKLATAIDVTTIWYLILLGMGIAIVAGVKRASGYIAVFAWWALIVLAGAGAAAIFS